MFYINEDRFETWDQAREHIIKTPEYMATKDNIDMLCDRWITEL